MQFHITGTATNHLLISEDTIISNIRGWQIWPMPTMS